jgi:hypothetical protein
MTDSLTGSPRLIPIGNFPSEGLGHLTIPPEALRRAEQAIAAAHVELTFTVGERVAKVGGDYHFSGAITAAFVKLDGRSRRYVVENADGVLHIFSSEQLARSPKEAT